MQTRDALFALIDDEVWQPLERETQRLVRAAALIPSPAISTLVASGFTDAPAGIATVFEKIPFVTAVDDDAFLIHDLFREFVASRTPADDDAGEIATSIGVALVETGHPADGLRLLVAAKRVDDVERALGLHAFDLLESGHPQRGRRRAGVARRTRTQRSRREPRGQRRAFVRRRKFGECGQPVGARALQSELPPAMRSDVARRLAINYMLRNSYDEALTDAHHRASRSRALRMPTGSKSTR